MVEADYGQKSSSGENVYADSTVVNSFTLEDARKLDKPTDKILCTLADNTYISFGEYSVVDHHSRTTLLHVEKERNELMDRMARAREADGSLTMNDRILKHSFSPLFFKLKTLELNLEFTNVHNGEPLKEIVLVEKHFFRDEILSQFEF